MKTKQWRDLGRPEAALVGVQYRGNDDGKRRAPWTLTGAPATRWVFARTGPRPGYAVRPRLGHRDRPHGRELATQVQVLAEIPDLFGPGFTAQMTYYETETGARVFAAGAFSIAGHIGEPHVSRVVENLWREARRRKLISSGCRSETDLKRTGSILGFDRESSEQERQMKARQRCPRALAAAVTLTSLAAAGPDGSEARGWSRSRRRNDRGCSLRADGAAVRRADAGQGHDDRLLDGVRGAA